MSTIFAYLGLPVIAFVVLALLPRGWPALIGIVVAAALVLVIGPVVLPEDGSGYASLLLWVFGGAVAAAALAQGVRMVQRAVSYPVVVALVLLAATAVIARILGIF